MSGIVGIWHLDGRPADRAELARLAAMIRHRGGDAAGLRIDGGAGLAVQLRRVTPESARETQPVVGDEGVWLAFDGRIDNRDELIAALDAGGGVPRESPDSHLVLAAYRTFGEACLERLNGDFALAVFDLPRRRLLLARDAIGVRPLYFHATPHLVIFASEIKAIVGHPAVPSRPDEETLADFLFTRFTGAPPTARTFFQDVSSVLPGHVVVADASGVRMAPYWDFDAGRTVRFARHGDYVDAFREHFDRAVRRRLRCLPRAAVSVSGGLDSSAIFYAAHRTAPDNPAVGVSQTFPDGSPSDEKVFLADLERASGSRILRLHDPPVGMTDDCRNAIWHSEMPFLDGQWNATNALLAAARQAGARVLLTGHWGDQFLFDDAYLVDLCRQGRWRTAWRHVTTFPRWMDVPASAFRRRLFTGLLKYHVPAAVISGLRSARKRLRRGADTHVWASRSFRDGAGRRAGRGTRMAGASAHASAIYREVRSPYATSCMERNDKIAAMHGLETAFPFLDRDLVAFLMAIPGDVQARDGVPKSLLRDAGVLPDAIAARRSKADFTARTNAGAGRDRAELVDCIRSGGLSLERGYVDREQLDALADMRAGIDAPTAVAGWALADLFSLEIWLQEFVGGSGRKHSWRIVDAQAI